MNEKQKECILEIQDLIIKINETVKKHGLENEFLSCIGVGFVNLDTAYLDEDGAERANMSLLSSFSVADEDELDDLLSYCLEAYRIEAEETRKEEEEKKMSNIDYWINLAQRNGGLN